MITTSTLERHVHSKHRSESGNAATLCVAMAAAILTLGSCGPALDVSPAPLPLPPEAVMPPVVNLMGPPADSICTTTLNWPTCSIPLYTDDQAFMASKTTYGPHAFVAPSPRVSLWTDDSQFQGTTRLVAIVLVEKGPLPPSYTELDLRTGITCVYLTYTNGRYIGLLAGLNSATPPTCAETAPTGAAEHEVRAIAVASPYTADSIPPVARFHEGKKGSDRGNPAIGGRCAKQWCIITANKGNSTEVDTLPDPHRTVLTEKTGRIHGWHDAQTLSLPPVASPGGLIRTNMEASVVPDQQLLKYNAGPYPTEFKQVADVYFERQPQGRYASVWKFRRGHNLIFMKKNPDGTYAAELRHWTTIGGVSSLTTARTLKVDREPHPGMLIPSTARFRWTINDEDVWVSCEAGCCLVSAS